MQSIMTAVMSLIAFLWFSTHRLFQRMPSKFSRTKANVMIARILFICTGILSFPGFGALLPYYYKSAIKKRSINTFGGGEYLWNFKPFILTYLLMPFSDRINSVGNPTSIHLCLMVLLCLIERKTPLFGGASFLLRYLLLKDGHFFHAVEGLVDVVHTDGDGEAQEAAAAFAEGGAFHREHVGFVQ